MVSGDPFPNDLAIRCDLVDRVVELLPQCKARDLIAQYGQDQCVAVGQAPGIADERAVKSPFGGIAVAAGILPDDLLLDRIDLQRVRAGEDFEPR